MTYFSSRVWLLGSALTIGISAYAAPAQDTLTAKALTPATKSGLTTNNQYSPLPVVPSAFGVAPISDSWRTEFGIDAYYTKGVMVRGIPIISSAKASDYALLECAYLLDHMFAGSPQWVQAALTKSKTRMCVMSVYEYTMDLPESNSWQTDRSLEKMAFWDQRARGMGGLPDASCAEENLLNLASDPHKSENITLHEFSHTTASAIKEANPDWYKRLEETYKKAMAAGRFAHSYAASNEQEYWAEGSQDWFDCNSQAKDSIHNGIWNRELVKEYDPDLAKLLAEVYGDVPWRYLRSDGQTLKINDKVYSRSADEMTHLAGLDRSQFPAFKFADSPRIRAYKASTPTETAKK